VDGTGSIIEKVIQARSHSVQGIPVHPRFVSIAFRTFSFTIGAEIIRAPVWIHTRLKLHTSTEFLVRAQPEIRLRAARLLWNAGIRFPDQIRRATPQMLFPCSGRITRSVCAVRLRLARVHSARVGPDRGYMFSDLFKIAVRPRIITLSPARSFYRSTRCFRCVLPVSFCCVMQQSQQALVTGCCMRRQRPMPDSRV
jgi:hypothetical protein